MSHTCSEECIRLFPIAMLGAEQEITRMSMGSDQQVIHRCILLFDLFRDVTSRLGISIVQKCRMRILMNYLTKFQRQDSWHGLVSA